MRRSTKSRTNSTQARSPRRFGTKHVAVAVLSTLAALSCEKNSMNHEDAGASMDAPHSSDSWLDAGSSTGGTSAHSATETAGSGGMRMGTTSSGGSSGDSWSVDAGSSGGSSGREGSAGRGGSGANPGAISKPPGPNPGHIGRTGSAGSGH